MPRKKTSIPTSESGWVSFLQEQVQQYRTTESTVRELKRCELIAAEYQADAAHSVNELWYQIHQADYPTGQDLRELRRRRQRCDYWKQQVRHYNEQAARASEVMDLLARNIADLQFPGEQPYEPTREESAAIATTIAAGGNHARSTT